MAVLNLVVPSGANDGYYNSALNSVNTAIFVDSTPTHTVLRFTGAGIADLAGATVTDARLSLYGQEGASGSVDVKLHLEMAASPAFPSDAADAAGRSLTTGTAYDNVVLTVGAYEQSVDFSAEFTQLLGSHSPTTLQIFVKHVASDYLGWESYDEDPAKAAKLDITYTAAATTTSPLAGGSLAGGALAGGSLAR